MQDLLHPDHSSSMSLIISLSVSAMPSFAKRLSIPEKQTKLFVSDEQLFRELRNEHRRIADAESPAQRGDYVLVETDDGHGVKKKLHIGITFLRLRRFVSFSA